MTAEEIIQGNKMIAEFMDAMFSNRGVYRYRVLSNTWAAEGLKYHSSWDWLMPVVEKIEAMGFEIDICKNSCVIMTDLVNIQEPIRTETLPMNRRYEERYKEEVKIESVYKCVCDFIKWYNSQNK